MKDTELEQLLKSAQVPELPEARRREFPKRVTAKLHWQEIASGAGAVYPRKIFDIRLAWGLALAAACVVIALIIRNQPTQSAGDLAPDHQLTEARKCYREFEALFPNQLQGIVFDQHGPRMVLAEKPVVPDSTPFYLRICGPGGCEGFVTFSGQQVQLNGESCEVLADAQGRVMLVGNSHVWEENNSKDSIRIQATPLEAVL